VTDLNLRPHASTPDRTVLAYDLAAWPKTIGGGHAQEQANCPGNAASRLVNREGFSATPGKWTQVRSLDQLSPLEIVLEVRGTLKARP
jgi:hypothetical protein